LCPIAPLGAALMTLIASFTRHTARRQTYLSFMLLVPTLPVIFAAITNVESSPKLMWIPSLSQHLLVTTLIKAQPLDPLLVALSAGRHARVRPRCSPRSRLGCIDAKQFSVRAAAPVM
jgi:ABC-type Na+ efflux pump permease subunit